MSALFRWPCSISVHLSPRSVTGHAAFLVICLPGLSLVVSALFRWRCNISIHLSPRSVTCGVRPFPLAMHISIRLSPRSVTGHAAFLVICLPGLPLVVSALFCWPCSISIHSPNSLLLGVLNSFLRCVRPLCHCWCPPISTGHVAFLFACLPGLSLVVSALFRWPCSISIHVSRRSVTGGVRPFPLVV